MTMTQYPCIYFSTLQIYFQFYFTISINILKTKNVKFDQKQRDLVINKIK